MTTKAQEQEALDQIRGIVSALDSDGYVATALEGCCDIAQQNIDNDWLCSYRQKAESMANEAEALRATIRDNNGRINALLRDLQQANKEKISGADASKILSYLRQMKMEMEKRSASAAAEIVKYADHPTEAQFTEARAAHRWAAAQVKDLDKLIERLPH